MNHDYKYEGMSEEDRNILIPAIKGAAKNTEPEKRDRFVSDLIKARNESAKNDQIIQDVLAQRDELLAALKDSEIAFRYIRDFVKPYKTIQTKRIVAWGQWNSDKAQAAIAKAEGRAE